MVFNWVRSPMVVVAYGQHYNVEEKPNVILYTYIINRHAGKPKQRQKHKENLDISWLFMLYWVWDRAIIRVLYQVGNNY